MLKTAGLDPVKFGLHSPRIGGATDAFCNNVPDYIIDIQGRWKCPTTKYRYLRVDENRVLEQLKNSSVYK